MLKKKTDLAGLTWLFENCYADTNFEFMAGWTQFERGHWTEPVG